MSIFVGTVIVGMAIVALGIARFEEGRIYAIWDWLRSETKESKSATLRNAFIVVGGLIGILLASWRSFTASQQVSAANRQADTNERGLRNDRYQKGADMLGSKNLSVRLGGIYALERLAQDSPKEYLDPIIKLISTFARHPTRDDTLKNSQNGLLVGARQDVVDAVWAIIRLNNNIESHDTPNLMGIDLSGAAFSATDAVGEVDFNGIRLGYAKMHSADFVGANFTGADLAFADLSHTRLIGADFTGADLFDADMSGADISKAELAAAEGLFQGQLNQACQSLEDFPPNLPNNLIWEENEAIRRYNDIHERS